MTRSLLIALLLLVAAAPAQAFDRVAFDPPVLVGNDLGPLEEVELVDLDGDGDLDIVVCGAAGVGWYLQEPEGWVWVPGPTAACQALEVGDMDRDTQVDVITIEPGVGMVVHYLDSLSTWTSHVVEPNYGVATEVQDFAVVDVDRDGWLDMSSPSNGGSALEQLNHGGRDEGFGWQMVAHDIGQGTQVQAGDFDHDGQQELAVLDATTDTFKINGWGKKLWVKDFGVLEDGAEGFVFLDWDQNGLGEVAYWGGGSNVLFREVDATYGHGCCGPMTGVSIAELDHDGRPEVIGVVDDMLRVSHRPFDPGEFPGTQQDVVPFAATGHLASIPGDLDGDGDLDLILYDDAGVHLAVNRTPHVDPSIGAEFAIPGTWSAPTLVLSGQLDHVLSDDLVVAGRNGDGLTALLTLTFNAYPPKWSAHTITARTVGSVGLLVDLDFDGALDVVAADAAGHLYGWESQSDATAWTEHDLARDGVTALAAGDVDRDGDDDLIVGTVGGEVYWVSNNRKWGVGVRTDMFAGSGPVTGLDVGDVDRDGDVDVVALVEGEGSGTVSWLSNPGSAAGPWPTGVVHVAATSVPTRVALLDVDHNGQLDLLVDDDGTLEIKTPTATSTGLSWATVASQAAGSQRTSAPVDMDGDGVYEVLVWDGASIWIHGYDARMGAWEPPLLVRDEPEEPFAMTAFLRAPWDGVMEPVIARGGASPGLAFMMGEVGTSVTGGLLPVPVDEGHMRFPAAWVVAVVTQTYGAKPGDAAVAPGRVRMRGKLEGARATGADLASLGAWSLWADADADGILDPLVDTLVPSTVSTSGQNLDILCDLAAGVPSLDPQSSGTWFVRLQPSLGASVQPAQALELRVYSVVSKTVPLGLGLARSWSSGITGTWLVGNTEPLFGALTVPVEEGGEVLFDPLEGVADADGDPLTFMVMGQPSHGLATVDGSQIRYVQDGSEVAEDVLLVEVHDGLEAAPRVIVFDVAAIDDPPWAIDAAVTGLEDVPLTVALTGGDADDATVFELTVLPDHGEAILTDLGEGPIVSYTPDLNYAGTDAFQFVVHGGPLTSAPATVTLTVVANNGDDDDSDGLADVIDLCPDDPDPLNLDTDNDGVGDACDDDDDGDGLPDVADPCPLIPAPGASGVDDLCSTDDDGDGVADVDDLCPFVPDPGQDDLDGDGLGDACDDDDDGDLVPDDQDNCLTEVNHDQFDTDGDGDGDACDEDDDNDGEPDLTDVCPWLADPAQLDLDQDGVGDACDGDADSDGAPAAMDCDDLDPTVQSPNVFYADGDGDGFGDAGSPFETCASAPPEGTSWFGGDNCPALANADQSDMDGDGLGDACDPTPDPSTPGSGDSGTSDAGSGDAAVTDAGSSDAGSTDAGVSDVGGGGAGGADSGCSQSGRAGDTPPWGLLILLLFALRQRGVSPGRSGP